MISDCNVRPRRMRCAPVPRACVLSMVMMSLLASEAGYAAVDTRGQTLPPAAVDFDSETLRQRGIAPEVSNYFRESPRFQAGAQTITLVVNGTPLRSVRARFDANGALCWDRRLLDQAGL